MHLKINLTKHSLYKYNTIPILIERLESFLLLSFLLDRQRHDNGRLRHYVTLLETGGCWLSSSVVWEVSVRYPEPRSCSVSKENTPRALHVEDYIERVEKILYAKTSVIRRTVVCANKQKRKLRQETKVSRLWFIFIRSRVLIYGKPDWFDGPCFLQETIRHLFPVIRCHCVNFTHVLPQVNLNLELWVMHYVLLSNSLIWDCKFRDVAKEIVWIQMIAIDGNKRQNADRKSVV